MAVITSSLDQLPVMFRCPACTKPVQTTRMFLFRTPLQCPKCHAEIERAKIQGDLDRSMTNFPKLRRELGAGE